MRAQTCLKTWKQNMQFWCMLRNHWHEEAPSDLSWAFFSTFVPSKTQKSCDVILIGHKEMAAKSMPDQHQKIPYLVLGRLWHGLQWLTEQHPQLLNVILTFYYRETGTSSGRTLWSSVNLFSLPEHRSNMRTMSLIKLFSNWHIWWYHAICQ